MKTSILKYAGAVLLIPTLTACMDFDTPADEFATTEKEVSGTIYSGDADKLDYTVQPTEEEVEEAMSVFESEGYFGNILMAQYYLMGSKDGAMTSMHQYQYIYSLTTDNYAGYTTCTQSWGGKMETTYSYTRDFSEGPYGRFLSMKNYLGNPLNIDLANNIVEIKAICLLLFDYVAQENTDLYGSIPYVDHKANKETNPFAFNKGIDIYVSIIQNLDDINDCLANFENRPDWYKKQIQEKLWSYDGLTQDKSIESWRRLANSLKLRMAMHLVKVMPTEAQQWAEEAVAAGVISSQEQEVGLNRRTNCFEGHPLKGIMSSWNDVRVNASFVSMLTSLNHPYIDYFIEKNSGDLVNAETGEVFPANTAIVGLRAGLRMENSQQYFSNMRVAYSQFTSENFSFMPLYAFKWAEADFLRAEGALRGWDMGGSADFFYERGIRNADCGERFDREEPDYDNRVDDYLAVETATPYTYIDPMDDANNIESVTKIGVKWNDGDDPETKLEKIITQKYIALFPYSYEAWTEMRRTGYPKIFPVLNPQLGDGSLQYGDLIRRMPLPHGDTQAGMEDIQNSGIEALGGADLQATRVFWDTQDANF